MTEIPEHLLRRSQAAKDRAAREGSELPEHLRPRNVGVEVRMTSLATEIAKIEGAFDVNVVVVPVGMPKADAEAALNALSPLGDMSPEFLTTLASLVVRNVAPQ